MNEHEVKFQGKNQTKIPYVHYKGIKKLRRFKHGPKIISLPENLYLETYNFKPESMENSIGFYIGLLKFLVIFLIIVFNEDFYDIY